MEKKFKVRDNVHGDIFLPSITREIIDSCHFQRLRYIAQNGLLYLVFPAARHTRFEHSLGVGYLANQWFNSIKNFCTDYKKFGDELLENGTKLCFQETIDVLDRLFSSPKEKTRWENIVTLAGLLHDIGHGPLSHTIESLEILKFENFKKGAADSHIIDYFENGSDVNYIEHEDVGLIYLDRIFSEMKSDFYSSKNMVLIGSLFNKGFRSHVSKNLSETEINYVELFSIIISSFCDVDRFDYLLRDSRNSGTAYDFEMKRIMNTLFPILVTNDQNVRRAEFLTNAKNIHMIDCFLFSLYQFYVQVLFHPRQIQFYNQLKLIMGNLPDKTKNGFDFDWHKKIYDAKFFDDIDSYLNSNMLKKLLTRRYKGEVVQTFGTDNVSQENDWHCVGSEPERKLLKDHKNIWLYCESVKSDTTHKRFQLWDSLSVIASKLKAQSFRPVVWWKSTEFDKDLSYLSKPMENSKSSMRF